MAKKKETPLELCHRATVFGNTISIRMLEYLSSAKHQQSAFKDLAADFLDVCRILWSMEAGLTETARKQNHFPEDIIKELENRFRQTNDDFLVLNQLVLKFLDYDRRGALAKFQKGFTKMFADKDMHKMRDALAKNRNALRMSAAVFRWSLGDATVESAVGIGYTGLVAAVERLNTARPAVLIPESAAVVAAADDDMVSPARDRLDRSPATSSPTTPSVLHRRSPPMDPPPQQRLPPLPPALTSTSTSTSTSSHLLPGTASSHQTITPLQTMPSRPDDRRLATPEWPDRQSSQRILSADSSDSVSSLHRRESVFSKNTPLSPASTGDTLSEASLYTKSLWDDRIISLDLESAKSDVPLARLKVDPTSVPRWLPRQSMDANPALSRSALLAAVQTKKHAVVEQLLDSGATPDVAVLKAALVNRDLDSVRLLLLFGAKPNDFDADGLTPLLVATKAAFPDAAKLLIKYGADPNLLAASTSRPRWRSPSTRATPSWSSCT